MRHTPPIFPAPTARSVSILIPAFNEAATIAELLRQVLAVDLGSLTKEIIIVEANSTDGTRAIVQRFEEEGKIKAIYEDRPRGKGHAIKKAFQAATGDILLIQDADLEYRPSEYPDLLAPFSNGNVHFVLGSRHLGEGSWRFRKFIKSRASAYIFNIGNHACNFLFNTVYGTTLTDPTTMFKVFRRTCIKPLHFRSNFFELDWEIVAKLIKAGYLPLEVPISYVSRSFQEGKKIKFWRDGLLSLYAIFRFRWAD